ncbi:MAG: PilZ domain-containing protein [Elusimicrobiaceae bacterium]|nr:PilZ domain-containing protein [Elusimicrobiaceae bacterium]
MKKKNVASERRRHPRLPVISNLIEPVNLRYRTQEGKEVTLVAILADLSASGMRMISFLGAPLADHFSISLQLPGTDKMEVEARLAWVKERENVYTIGIEFTKLADKHAKLISEMADDFNDCDTRILLKLPEPCVGTCKCNKICNKIQKDESLFE